MPPKNLQGLLKKTATKRAERVKDLHLDLPIPTWDGDLVARFGILPRREVEAFSEKRRSLDADMDFLITATHCLYARDPDHTSEGERMEENDDYVRVEAEDGRALKFEQSLGEALGMKVAEENGTIRGRTVVMYCFKDNAIAIGGFVARVVTWMQNTDAEIAERLVGE